MSAEKTPLEQAQAELEFRLRAVAVDYSDAHIKAAPLTDALNRHIEQGKRELGRIFREPVDVAALAVGTTFRAPHINLSSERERLWVRTPTGIMDLSVAVFTRFTTDAVDPRAVHSVQPPAEDGQA